MVAEGPMSVVPPKSVVPTTGHAGHIKDRPQDSLSGSIPISIVYVFDLRQPFTAVEVRLLATTVDELWSANIPALDFFDTSFTVRCASK